MVHYRLHTTQAVFSGGSSTMFGKRRYEPDFSQLLKVLQRERPDRPVLFEFFMNPAVYAAFAGDRWIPGSDPAVDMGFVKNGRLVTRPLINESDAELRNKDWQGWHFENAGRDVRH